MRVHMITNQNAKQNEDLADIEKEGENKLMWKVKREKKLGMFIKSIELISS